MDRMSPLDASFLHIEDGVAHMHIGSCAIFEGPAPAFDDLVRLMAGKLQFIPRYRQRVRFVPLAMGRPVWVDDPHFRLEYHVRHTALPAPGSDEDLRNLMGRLMSQPLDRNRPLWEAWVVEGLADGHWALISKVHHCMVDGISGTDLMAVMLDDTPDAVPPPPDDWRPAPEPTDAELVAEALGELARSPAEQARRLRAVLRAPRRMAGDLAEFVGGLRSLGSHLTPLPPLSIEGPIGPHRRWAWARTTLADIRQVRTAFGGTVNDVVLAAITAGFRELLLARGDDLTGAVVRTLVPVSVRARDDHSANNQVSAMFAELPVAEVDPIERLRLVSEQLAGLKESHMAVAAEALVRAAGSAPALFAAGLRAGTTLMRRLPQRSMTTVTTNVPGPQRALYACGREMLEYLPFVPLAHGVRVGVAIVSYHGKVGFGVTGDWDSVPDVDLLARGIEAGMAELVKLADAAGAQSRP